MSDGAPVPRVPLDVLRAAVREVIGTRSLRETAAQIGISHTGLRGFLKGARPHRHTRRKLEAWLAAAGEGQKVRERATRYGAAPGRETYRLGRAAVRALAEAADADGVDRAVVAYDALIRRIYRDAGLSPPSWIEDPDD